MPHKITIKQRILSFGERRALKRLQRLQRIKDEQQAKRNQKAEAEALSPAPDNKDV